jgi:hypothetical protein
MKSVLVFTALAVLALAVPAQAREIGSVTGSWPLNGVSLVRVNFPAGHLTIQSGQAPEARATLVVRCKHASRAGIERSKRVKLITEIKGSTREFRIEPAEWKSGWHGLTLDLTIEVPARMAVETAMGAGELDFYDLEGHVEAALGAGKVDVRAPEGAVRSVDASVGVGDVSLRRHGVREDSHGFIARTILWEQGRGKANLKVHLGVGDVAVGLE